MRRILSLVFAFLACLGPATAQTYPSPTFAGGRFNTPPLFTGQHGYCYWNGEAAVVCSANVPGANISYTSPFAGAVSSTVQAALNSYPIPLYPNYCADNTGGTDCSAGILAWLNAAGVSGKAAYCPGGIYKASEQVEWNVHAFATNMPMVVGDGKTCNIKFDTNVPSPNFWVHANSGDNVVYGGFVDIGFTCNTNGICFQLGLGNLLDPFNDMPIRIYLQNLSQGASAVGADFGALYNVSIDGVYDGGGLHANPNVGISNASPAVITWTGHGLPSGTPLQFTVGPGGSLPSPLVPSQTYYVISPGLATNSFEIAATVNGSAINTSTAGSGAIAALAYYGYGLCAAQFNQIGMSRISGSYGNSGFGFCFGSGSQSLFANSITGLDTEANTYDIVMTSSAATNNRFVGVRLSLATYGVYVTTGVDNSIDGASYGPMNQNIFNSGCSSLCFALGPFQPGVFSQAAPAIASGFCTSPTVATGTGSGALIIHLGTGCAAATGSLTMPIAPSGWTCNLNNVSAPNSNVLATTGSTATTVNIANYARTTGSLTNFTDSQVITGVCAPF